MSRFVTLVFPANITTFTDSTGAVSTPDASGRVQVDTNLGTIGDFFNAGFVVTPDLASASRPTQTYPGQHYFDTSLNGGVGLPIWRNAANTAWINAAGTVV